MDTAVFAALTDLLEGVGRGEGVLGGVCARRVVGDGGEFVAELEEAVAVATANKDKLVFVEAVTPYNDYPELRASSGPQRKPKVASPKEI